MLVKSSSWSKTSNCGSLVCGLSDGMLAEKTSGEAGIEVFSSSESDHLCHIGHVGVPEVTFVTTSMCLMTSVEDNTTPQPHTLLVPGIDIK